jgi:hypothetical protein
VPPWDLFPGRIAAFTSMEIVNLESLVRFSNEKMQKVPLFDSEKCFL